MRQARPNYLIFLHDFILLKLAYHLKVEPKEIIVSKMDGLVSNFDLSCRDKKYVIKMSNPVYFDKDRKVEFWDFDVRLNNWEDKKNKRVSRSFDECDYYLLIGMIDSIPRTMFLLPSKDTPKAHVRVSIKGKSKYRKYVI